MPDLTDTIEENAAKPKSATTDQGSVTAHSLPELVEADKYLKESEAAATPGLGIRFRQLVPGGTI